MSEEMYTELKRFIDENKYDFILTCGVFNKKYGTGFTVPELRRLYTSRFGEQSADRYENLKTVLHSC